MGVLDDEDIVPALRRLAELVGYAGGPAFKKAADEIERLRALLSGYDRLDDLNL